MSHTSKYLSKIYGKTFLAQLKREELEAKSRMLREEAAEKRELEKAKRDLVFSRSSRLATAKSDPAKANALKNSKKTRVESEAAVVSRPAFLTIPFKSFTESTARSTSASLRSESVSPHRTRSNEASKKAASNVALVTITPRTQSPVAKTTALKDLKKQVADYFLLLFINIPKVTVFYRPKSVLTFLAV